MGCPKLPYQEENPCSLYVSANNFGGAQKSSVGNYETYFRDYDPALGRFTGVDIMAGKFNSWTPYQFAFNNPISFNDPMGDEPRLLREERYSSNYYSLNEKFFSMPGRIGPGSPNDWLGKVLAGTEYGKRRDYYFMDGRDFEERYGESTSDYRIDMLLDRAHETGDAVTYINDGYYSTVETPYGTSINYTENWTVDQNGGCPKCPNGWSVGDVMNDPQMVYAGVNPFEENSALRENGLNTAAGVAGIMNGAASIASYSPRPTYTGPVEWSNTVKGASKFGNRVAVVGLVFTGVDMLSNGVNTSNSLDAVMGGVGFGGPVGAIVSGVYFVGNMVTTGVTGESIGQHIDKYYWIPNPSGLGFIPTGKKPN